MRKLVYKGKSKDVYDLGNGLKEFVFTDRISAMDRNLPTPIPGKGIALCDISCFWFDKLNYAGIANHFIERIGERSILVKSINIIRNYSKIIDAETNHLIPLEFITRSYVAGSLHKRLLDENLCFNDLGLNSSDQYGTQLPNRFFEITTKLEDVDVFVSSSRALKISNMSIERLAEIRNICFSVDDIINTELAPKGLTHVDGKKEFGYDAAGNLMLVDVCGTPDEDRFWISLEGKREDLSKEILRSYLRDTEFYRKLTYARVHNEIEPQFPELPDDLAESLSQMYRTCRSYIC